MTSPDTNPKIKEAMDTLLKMFDEDNLEKVARAVFRGGDIPADKWSFLNRVLMYLNDGCFWETHPKGKIRQINPIVHQLIFASATRFPFLKL